MVPMGQSGWMFFSYPLKLLFLNVQPTKMHTMKLHVKLIELVLLSGAFHPLWPYRCFLLHPTANPQWGPLLHYKVGHKKGGKHIGEEQEVNYIWATYRITRRAIWHAQSSTPSHWLHTLTNGRSEQRWGDGCFEYSLVYSRFFINGTQMLYHL